MPGPPLKLRLVEQRRERVPCKDGRHPYGDWGYFWVTATGERLGCCQPGDAYYAAPWVIYGDRQPEPGLTADPEALEEHRRHCYWANCDGRHLWVFLPNGQSWSPDYRARNCTMPTDRLHRCWVKHGSPEDGTIHVDKVGLTCAAGGGSIGSTGWHGFLEHGFLVER